MWYLSNRLTTDFDKIRYRDAYYPCETKCLKIWKSKIADGGHLKNRAKRDISYAYVRFRENFAWWWCRFGLQTLILTQLITQSSKDEDFTCEAHTCRSVQCKLWIHDAILNRPRTTLYTWMRHHHHHLLKRKNRKAIYSAVLYATQYI